MKSKILVFGIILLFTGVGFQPVLSIEIKNSNKINEVENDCGCKGRIVTELPVICSLLYILRQNIPGTVPFPFNIVIIYFINIIAIALNCSWYPAQEPYDI